jgi:hypothetical protein
MQTNAYNQEWTVLQNQYDAYERASLGIKLFAVAVLVTLIATQSLTCYAIALLPTLWLLDAIWKTFQSRIEVRILVVEAAIEEGKTDGAFQFNRDFLKTRPSTVSLISVYVKQALRPTIAYPHVVILVLGVLILI